MSSEKVLPVALSHSCVVFVLPHALLSVRSLRMNTQEKQLVLSSGSVAELSASVSEGEARPPGVQRNRPDEEMFSQVTDTDLACSPQAAAAGCALSFNLSNVCPRRQAGRQ